MSVTIFTYKHLLCARWATITRADLDDLLARAQTIERTEKRKLIYAGIQYEDTSLPDRDVSRVLIDRAMTLAKSCDRFYLVIAAQGVAGSLHRSAVRSMLTLARMAGADVQRARVMDSVNAMLADAEPDLPASRAELRAALTQAGIP